MLALQLQGEVEKTSHQLTELQKELEERSKQVALFKTEAEEGSRHAVQLKRENEQQSQLLEGLKRQLEISDERRARAKDELLDARWESLTLRGSLLRKADSAETPSARILELENRIERLEHTNSAHLIGLLRLACKWPCDR